MSEKKKHANAPKKEKRTERKEKRTHLPEGFHRAIPIILLAFATFTGVCYIAGEVGAFGAFLSDFLLGLFSYGAYAVPLLIAVHALFYLQDVKGGRLVTRIVFSFITLIAISTTIYTVQYRGADTEFLGSSYYALGMEGDGGGLIGSTVGYGLSHLFGNVGVIIIAVAVFILYVVYFFSGGKRTLGRVGYKLLHGTVAVLAFIERKIKGAFCGIRNASAKRRQRKIDEKSRDLLADDYFAVDNGIESLRISELGISETRSRESIEAHPSLHDKVYHKSEVASGDEIELDPKDAYVEINYEEKSSHKSKDRGSIYDHGIDVEDIPTPKKAEPVREEAPSTSRRTTDDNSADDIFTRSFDPFSIAASEELAGKPSSRTAAEARGTVKEDLNDLTEEEVERARRNAAFEKRKAEIVKNAKRSEPTGATFTAGETERKTIDFKETTSYKPSTAVGEDENVVTVRYNKTEDQRKDTGYGSYTASPYNTTRVDPTPINESYDTPAPVKEQPSSVVEETSFTAFRSFDEKKTEGLVFEFENFDKPEDKRDEQKTLTVERTILGHTADRDAAPEDELCDEPAYESEPEQTLDDYAGEDDEYEAPEETPVEPDEDEEPEEEYTQEPDDSDEPLDDEEEIPPEKQNPAINGYRDLFTIFRDKEEPKREEPLPEVEDENEEEDDVPFDTDESPALTENENVYEEDADEDEPLPFEREEVARRESAARSFVEPSPKPKKDEGNKSVQKKPDYSDYVAPPLDLLTIEHVNNDDEINAEINQNTTTLIETLASFNVTASIKGVDRGPRVTRYEVVPARGVKVNAITGLFDNIAMNLAAEGIRMEAPIPGKSAIGFEIPNKHPINVRLRELLECEEFVNAKSKTFVCIGKDVGGNPVFGDIAKFPHALVAGATGMGKSVCINSIMISLLYKARPDEVKFIMIDPKKVEFRMYSGIPHLLIPVITEAKQAAGALMWAVEEMERRYALIEPLNIRNIESYNERCAEDKSLGEPLPKIVIVIDELNDLMMQVRDPVEDLIMRLAQKARAAGIHLIIGTQRPDVKVITGTIKANINTRISCKVTSVVDSRTILEMAGAEKLLNRGDMLFKPVDKTKPIRVQGCFVSDPEVEAIMDFLKAQCDGAIYDDDVFAEINRAAQKCGNKKSQSSFDDDGGDGDDDVGYYNDQQFLDAVELAIRQGKVSTSLLQRKLSIGYGKAAKYIDAMEEIGIVSGQNGQKPRDVLLSMDEWHEKLSRVSFDD